MPNPPTLTAEQRAAAAQKGIEIRRAWAEWKDRIRKGTLSVDDAFSQFDDDKVARLKVRAFVEAIPGVGKVKAKRIMEECEIADNRRLGGLGAQQRARLQRTLASAA